METKHSNQKISYRARPPTVFTRQGSSDLEYISKQVTKVFCPHGVYIQGKG